MRSFPFQVRQPRKRDTLSCPLCDFTAQGGKNMLHHIELEHKQDMSFQSITFESAHDYDDWKKREEESVRCSFIKKSFHQSNKGVTVKWICNRSGRYNVCATKRRSRIIGTKKINKYCPAQIRAVFSDDEINVRYLKTHLGHDSDNKLYHMNLSADEKNAIIAQLKQNISPRAILKSMKYPLPELKSEYRRIHLLTLRDIRYIGKKYGIYKKNKEYKSDQLEQDQKNWFEANRASILFHKKTGAVDERYQLLESEDFVLILFTEKQKEMLQKHGENWICVDSTTGLNVFDFQLTTLMVLDRRNFAYPVAFMLSNKVNESVLTVLFQELKNEIGTVTSKTFTSDLCDEYVDAWTNVFPAPQFRFFSPWCVCRAWRESLNNVSFADLDECLRTPEELHGLRKKIYQFLKFNLLQETRQDVFEHELQSFLEPHCNLLEFQKFFETIFVPQRERWAFCFWKRAGIDGGAVVIEAFHKIVKYTLYGNKSKRLEKVPNLLLEYLNLKFEDEIEEVKKGVESRKIGAVKTRHRKSLKRSCDAVGKVKTGWIVEASANKKARESGELRELYYIQEIDSDDLCKNCPLMCAECNSCIHRYKCSCIDYRILGNMCKHIHLVCRFLASKETSVATTWSDVVSDISVLHSVTESVDLENSEYATLEDVSSQIVTGDGDVTSQVVNDDDVIGQIITSDDAVTGQVMTIDDAAAPQVVTTDEVPVYVYSTEYVDSEIVTNEQQELIDRLSLTVKSTSAENKMKVLEELARKMDLVICTEEEVIVPEENEEPQNYVLETIIID